jgi:hypothetical protein
MKAGDLVVLIEPDNNKYMITKHLWAGVFISPLLENKMYVNFFNYPGETLDVESNDVIKIKKNSILYIITGAYQYEREIEEIRSSLP